MLGSSHCSHQLSEARCRRRLPPHATAAGRRWWHLHVHGSKWAPHKCSTASDAEAACIRCTGLACRCACLLPTSTMLAGWAFVLLGAATVWSIFRAKTQSCHTVRAKLRTGGVVNGRTQGAVAARPPQPSLGFTCRQPRAPAAKGQQQRCRHVYENHQVPKKRCACGALPASIKARRTAPCTAEWRLHRRHTRQPPS